MMLRDKILEELQKTPQPKKQLEKTLDHKNLSQVLFYLKNKGYISCENRLYSFVKKPKKYKYKQVRVKIEVYDGC